MEKIVMLTAEELGIITIAVGRLMREIEMDKDAVLLELQKKLQTAFQKVVN